MAKFLGNTLIRVGKKIVGIGKNYEAHAREMGATHAPKEPVIFLKPTTCYARAGESIQLPAHIGSVHHEVELGVVIGKGGKDIREEDWEKHVAGYVVAIDMTARDLQSKAKAGGLPWTPAKCFDTFLPISDFVPTSSIPSPHDVEIWLKVDGVERQRVNTAEMVHKIPFLLSHISRIMALEEGDMIITGTPEGVGPVEPGNVVTAGIEGIVEMTFPVATREYAP